MNLAVKLVDRANLHGGGPDAVLYRKAAEEIGRLTTALNDGIRPEVVQEMFDALWMSRELRKRGYTMQTAKSFGLGDHYAMHGSQGLARYVEVAVDNAIHNAELCGATFKPAQR